MSQSSLGPTRGAGSGQLNRQTPLFRGAGCHNCRTRKVRCDAGKPFCGRCVAHGTTDKCQYDEIRKSKLTLLKEENNELKERLAKLERMMANSGQKISPPPEAASSTPTPPSARFSTLQLAEDGDNENESNDDIYNQPGESKLYENQAEYPVQPQPSYQGEHDTYQSRVSSNSCSQPIPHQPPQDTDPRTTYFSFRQHTSTSGAYYPADVSHQVSNQPYCTHQGYSTTNGVQPRLPPDERPTPHLSYDSQLAPDTHSRRQEWPNEVQASTGYIVSPSGDAWQQLPLLDPGSTPASPGGAPNQSAARYSDGFTFEEYGAYHGGAMASYDVYQGAPNRQAAVVARRRPVPSPPVFGQDVIISFFQRWRTDSRSYGHITGGYSDPSGSYNGSRALVGNWWERDDLPVYARDRLLEIFLPYRQQVGLVIWVPDFLASLNNLPRGRPHPGLMWMIYTFAAFFSDDEDLKALVPEFLDRAKRNLEESYAKSDRLFNYIQGQTLYASMLYMTGRINEGYQASNMACHAAIICGLHKMAAPVIIPQSQAFEYPKLRIRQIDFQLPPATCLREYGERIAAFWQLVIVDHTAGATTGLPVMFRDDGDERSKIETAFPRTMEEYVNGNALDLPYATLSDIFDPKFIPNPPDTDKTLQIKASALLERSVRLATAWSNGSHASRSNPRKYKEEYDMVLRAIQHFKSYLPPVYPHPPDGPDSRLPRTSKGLIWERLYPNYIVLNAEIQIYNILEETQPYAYDKCLRNAREFRALVEQLTDDEISQLGVMLGHCFTSASHVFLRELKRCRERNDERAVACLNRELDVIHHGLAVLGQNHHLASVQSERANRSRIEENPV